VQAALIRDGVHGLVLMGTAGEGNSLDPKGMDWNPQEGSHKNERRTPPLGASRFCGLAFLSSHPRLSDPTVSADNQPIPY
jgi:hypothetical protein